MEDQPIDDNKQAEETPVLETPEPVEAGPEKAPDMPLHISHPRKEKLRPGQIGQTLCNDPDKNTPEDEPAA